MFRSGNTSWQSCAKNNPNWAPSTSKGANRPPGVSDRIGYGAEPEPDQENEGQHGERIHPEQSALRNRIATAHKVGREPSEHPNGGADKTRTQLDRPPIELTDGIDGSKQQAIIDNRHKPGDRPEDKVERPRCGVGIGQRSDMEVRHVADEQAGHGDGGCRCTKRRYRNA